MPVLSGDGVHALMLARFSAYAFTERPSESVGRIAYPVMFLSGHRYERRRPFV
jgi:hypothetical protein